MTVVAPRIRRVCLALLLLLVVFYGFVGFYPFKLAPPPSGQQENGAELMPGTGLQFRSPGIARTLAAPDWLQSVIATSNFKLSLEVRANDREQYGPARIFTVSASPDLRNITVGQVGSNLSVRVRTQRTSLNGTPEYLIRNVFSGAGWHRIEILVTGKLLEIHVDGDSPVIERLTDQPLDVWDSGYRLALGNELTGDRPWLGEIRKAVVRVGDQSFNYLSPGSLHIAKKYSVTTAKMAHFLLFSKLQFNNATLMDWVINFLGFMPFGWLVGMLRRPRSGILPATLLAAAMSATIETGQLLFLVDRFPSTLDLILNTLGASVGAWIARDFELSLNRRPIDKLSKDALSESPPPSL